MIHFFRSRGYEVYTLYAKWAQIVKRQENLVRIADRVLVLGDHPKATKEGKRMPGVQTLHQESQNAGKAEYTEGHIIAHVSVVATNGAENRSLPLLSERQESPPRIEGAKKPDGDTLVTQMAKLAVRAAQNLNEKVLAVVDAYFAKAAFFEATKVTDGSGDRLVEIVTRAPIDTVAYTVPIPPTKRGRGQPRIYGDKVVLYGLFSDMTRFTETTMVLYGKETKVKYLCVDLIWKPVKELLRFVLVELNGKDRCVLISSSLTLSPEEIITAYGLRFKIETSFDDQKNTMGCFSYHFWTTALAKRKKWKKPEYPIDAPSEERVENAKNAIESFICLGTIATGILAIVAFTHNREIWKRYPGWLRTRRSTLPSIAVTKETLAHEFPAFLRFSPLLPMCAVVNSKLRKNEFLYEDVAS